MNAITEEQLTDKPAPRPIVKAPVFFTRGQIFDADGRKVCNVPNSETREDFVAPGNHIVRAINHYRGL